MNTLGHVLSLLLFVAVLTAGATRPALDASVIAPLAPAASTVRADLENRVISLTNARRVAHGCGRLRYRWSLVKAARNHSDRMADANVMSHQLYGEPPLGVRVTRAGYTGWTRLGENIGYGYHWPWQIVSAWMNSPGHRRLILDCRFHHIGVGLSSRNGVRWWTMDVGRR